MVPSKVYSSSNVRGRHNTILPSTTSAASALIRFRLSGSAETMTGLYSFVRFLALLQPLTFSPHTVRADPKVDQCLSLGAISQIANCLDPFTVSHSSLSLRSTCTIDIRGTGEHLDHRRSISSCPAFFPGTRGLLGHRPLCPQHYREWSSMHLSSIPIHPPGVFAGFRRAAPGRRYMSLGGKHSL